VQLGAQLAGCVVKHQLVVAGAAKLLALDAAERCRVVLPLGAFGGRARRRAVPGWAVASRARAHQVHLAAGAVVGGFGQGGGVQCRSRTTRGARHARLTPAVVQAGLHEGAVNVVAQKAHEHFLPDAGDELLAHAGACAALHHAQPAAVVAVGPVLAMMGGKTVGLPVELHFDATKLVGVELVCTAGACAAARAHHDGCLRAQCGFCTNCRIAQNPIGRPSSLVGVLSQGPVLWLAPSLRCEPQ